MNTKEIEDDCDDEVTNELDDVLLGIDQIDSIPSRCDSNFTPMKTEKFNACQRTISTQQLKLLGKVPGYDLYYSLTHPLK